jgi:hypothetical protein
MDKAVQEMIALLREMLQSQQRLLQIAVLRQEAMRSFDIERLNSLSEQERTETQNAAGFDNRRTSLVFQFRQMFGSDVYPGVSEIAKRSSEPGRTQLLSLAAQLKLVVEKLDRHTRINAKVSETVVKGLAKVLKVMTGLAQHAGLYLRNGRKAALRGIHLLEVTG